MKRRILNTLIVFFTTTILFSSCNKFLDTVPEDFLTPINYYETEDQLESGIAAVYSLLGHYALYGREMTRMGLDADDGFYDVVDALEGVRVYDVSATDPNVAGFWSTCYVGIYRANILLANLDRSVNVNEEVRNAIKGEALFLRSYFYFLLVSNFGGVPYIREPTDKTNIPRTPPEEVYHNIVQDMEEAEKLVKPIQQLGYGGRVSKSAVRGVLARVNLFMAGYPIYDESRYEEARKWAKLVIDDQEAGHELLSDFSQVFINYAADEYDIRESIWEIEFYGNNQGVYKEGGQIGAYNGIRYVGDDSNYGYSLGMVNASGTLWDKYEDPDSLISPDLRREWTIAPFSVSGNPAVEKARPLTEIYQRDCGKYRRKYEVVSPKDRQYTPINFPVLRYSDVLLMFAEAENQLHAGPSQHAYDAINQVRRRGYGLLLDEQADETNEPIEGVDLANLDQETFLRELQDERSRELSFEGLRKGDLVRWGIFIEKMEEARERALQASLPSSLNHAMRYFTNVSTRDVVWPIPSYEMGVNIELRQNPGW